MPKPARYADVSRWLQSSHRAAAVAAAVATAPGAWAATPLAVTQTAAGVYVHIGEVEDWAPAWRGDVANLGFVVGSRCVAVIDTGGTPAVGQALRAAIERATPLPVCYVINTHAHPDHMLGNEAFATPGAAAPTFVASARLPGTLAARAPYYLNALRRDFGLQTSAATIVYPTLKVESTAELDLGDRVLHLRAWPTAHTDNDLTVLDLRTRTLFTADLLFVQHLPVLDGSLRGWMSAMAELRRLDVATVVPGHGAVGTDWTAMMSAQADYLGALLSDTRRAIRQGWTIQQAIDRIAAPAAPGWRLTERFHRRNVTAAYAELEWEDDAAGSPTTPGASSAASGQRPVN
ncbi:quinoprotein relay system zinc metallohydrolase 2 [Ideonella sp. A 288]|uniref:quinoprotein relay system zinc metallohydrolase 2 n=1 Tax=Ideonella sp. A 288 TaxID=1962181 RepID=UPI000B4B825A|nr:quinoprotein relay system zinc metallohydrolase 2 [Ideonella sp. A 288]